MKAVFLSLLILLTVSIKAQDNEEKVIKFHPIQHSTLVIQYGDFYILVDPAGDIPKMKSFPTPDIVLVTHTHGDHLNPEALQSIKGSNTYIIGNEAAIDQLGYGISMHNGEKRNIKGIDIEAVPMYNLTEDRLRYHAKGDGNGYLINLGGEIVYIAGDTEDTKEVRSLKNIDHAFLPMNLPFTMTPEQAANAALAFKPKKVYPYHYSESDGFSDIEKFKKLLSKNPSIEVIFLDWYDKKEEN